MGKLPIDYIIESNDYENLISFLMFDCNVSSVTSSNNEYLLKLKNQQYLNQTGQTLFAKLYNIIDKDCHHCHDLCFNVIDKLLEEMNQVYDIEIETSIEKVLQMNNQIYKEKILRMLVYYWKVESVNFDHYKMIISKQSSYLNLFIILKENNKLKFEETFPQYLNQIKSKNIIQQDCNNLLAFMLKNNQNELMTVIITCPVFDVNKLIIESVASSFDKESITQLMTKLLENGYYVGNDGKQQIPLDWISSQVFEKFLDSKIEENNHRKIKIDYNFLVDPSIRDVILNELNDSSNDKLLFSSGMKALESILNNDRLKKLITHPVLSTFINLKTKKYQLIANTNFYLFLFGYLIPFFQITTCIVLENLYLTLFEKISFISILYADFVFGIYILIIICSSFLSTIYLTCRELVHLLWVCESIIIYLMSRSNLLKMLLITVSWIFIIGLFDSWVEVLYPSALIIICGTVELLSIIPYPSMSIYMSMLQQVAKTYIKFFTIFILIILAFSFSFCVAFNTRKDFKEEGRRHVENVTSSIKLDEYSSYNNGSFKELLMGFQKILVSIKSTDNVLKNFDSPLTSFVKTLQMLGGDYFDPYTLDNNIEIVLYLVFILTSFVLFNLINGLAISDIQSLKQQSEYLNLKKQIRNGAEYEDVICKMYNNIRLVD